jgi:hypothetical protein
MIVGDIALLCLSARKTIPRSSRIQDAAVITVKGERHACMP